MFVLRRDGTEQGEAQDAVRHARRKLSLSLSSFSYLVVRLPARVLLLRQVVADAVDDQTDVGLVDKVRRARDIVEVGRRTRPVLDLLGVADKPRRDVVVLGEALDLCQHLRHVLGLGDVAGALVVELVVRVDDEASNAVAKNSFFFVEVEERARVSERFESVERRFEL